MNIDHATPLLGGLTPRLFMRRHWQKKPLLVRAAIDPAEVDVLPAHLFDLAGRDDVRSRLVVRGESDWRLRHGPLARRALPSRKRARWTLLVQAMDRHRADMHALLARFRFVPQARLDDVMLSYASDGGGVGPHFDSYDVFLVQLKGHRRWRIGRLGDRELEPGLPLKILRRFDAEDEWLLAPGDMLYLPPDWAHDGVAQGECITASIGFRAPARDALAREVVQRMLDAQDDANEDAGVPYPARDLYRDPGQQAVPNPGRIPDALAVYSRTALRSLVDDPRSVACALGEWLSEPDADAWFEGSTATDARTGVALDRSTRMLYDRWHVFVNGESFRAGGRDATLMRRLADTARLSNMQVQALSGEARELLEQWRHAGWLQAIDLMPKP
ncbi:MAG: cupin domain-containing protein [Burkholderiaceae bacterium]